jgi:uncharacterized protein (DUF2235 family)
MPKNIIICSDGTGNTAIKGRGTNVFKLFEAVDMVTHRLDPHVDAQIALYDDGVGTEGFTALRLLGGAAGLGLARNVKELYRELSRVYDAGDRIFLFGFSRGAFTVRTLAGMIGACGVLNGAAIDDPKALQHAVRDAYAAYRAGYDSQLTSALGRLLRWAPRAEAVRGLRARWPVHENARIAFIGVWDTVDAVGMPFALSDFVNRAIVQFKFPTQTLGKHVERACHALSLEDERMAFAPVLWTVPDGGDSRVEQVWFSGVHANVGGGYPKQGLSLVALDWMLSRAVEHGLRVHRADRDDYARHASPDDKLYDSRAGLATFYRWRPRDVRRYCAISNVEPCIHLTVLERVAHAVDGYAPGNIPLAARVTITRVGDSDQDEAMRGRADAAERVLNDMMSAQGYMLDRVGTAIRVGEFSYWLFVASWLGLFGSAAATLLTAWRLGSVRGALASEWLAWSGLGFVVSLLGFAWALFFASQADRALHGTFTKLWHPWQPKLREAFKNQRRAARAQERASSLR